MAKQNKPAPLPDPVQDTIAIIRKLFTDYLDTAGAILQSHVFTEDAELELKEADKNLLEEIENLEVVTGDFDSIIEQLEKLIANKESEDEELLKLCNEESIIAAAGDCTGYAIIKITSVTDGDKLTDFVNENIYPYNIGGKSQFSMY